MTQPLRLIRSERAYDRALKEIDELMGAPKKGPRADRLAVLVLLVLDYEAKHYEIPDPQPVDAILFYMEQNDYTRAALGEILDASSGRVSEIMTGKRQLTVEQIRKLHGGWEIPLESLFGESKPRKPSKRGRKPKPITEEAVV